MNLAAHSKHRSSLSPHTPDLAQLKNEDRDTTRFSDIMAGNDDFLVTAFGQLHQQSELIKIQDEYPIVSAGDGYILYDLRNRISYEACFDYHTFV